MLSRNNAKQSIWRRLFVVISTLTLFTFVPAVAAADMDGSNLDTDLRSVEVDAAQISYHAGELEALLRHPGSFSFQSHKFELNRIRNRVNDLGKLIPKLQKEDLNPVQAEVIDDISGLTKAMASQLDKAIEYLDQNGSINPLTREDRAYAVRIAGIRHFSKHIDDLVDYAQARRDLDQARKEIESSGQMGR